MRKEPKSFRVEVKRRPAFLGRKPLLAAETPVPAPAEALFAPPSPAPAAVQEPERRILPCLVTEAAIDAARTEAIEEHPRAPRPRGRPRLNRAADDAVAAPPRKRGRPRKVVAVASVEAVKPAASAPLPKKAVATPPATPSVRASERRAATAELPRGERWKRRLPKALR